MRATDNDWQRDFMALPSSTGATVAIIGAEAATSTKATWNRTTIAATFTGERQTTHTATIEGVEVRIQSANSRFWVWVTELPADIARSVDFGFAPYWGHSTLKEAKAHAEQMVPQAVAKIHASKV